ncbi:MAG: putative peptidoglycan glycosyltransferase FtsW [Rectinemataceae bacterium]
MRTEYEGTALHDSGDGLDISLVAALGALALIGLAALWSASSGYALSIGKSPHYFALRQLAFLALSAGLFAIAATVPLSSLRKAMGVITIGALVFLALPLIPGVGDNRNGATRWIDLGFITIQPSEIWKTVMVLYLAHILDKRKDELRKSEAPLVAPSLLVLAGCGLIFFQNDFSTSLLTALAAIIVYFAAKVRIRFFVAVASIVAPLACLMVVTSEYRLERIIGFLVPGYDPHGMSYQVQGSVKAIGSGGLFGKGLGLGTRKLASIPEVQSDFVFAAFAEETGFLGVLVVFALWAFVAIRVYKAARDRDDFAGYASFGLLFLLCMQFLTNVAVVSGFVPATGVALPFFSAGGSSLLATALACGLLCNASAAKGFVPVTSESGVRPIGGVVHG